MFCASGSRPFTDSLQLVVTACSHNRKEKGIEFDDNTFMSVPDIQGLLRPVLVCAADGTDHSTTDFRQEVASSLKLTPDELTEKLRNSAQTIFANRIEGATVYLARAGALSRISTGVFHITDRGKELLEKYPDKITFRTLSAFPEFLPFRRGRLDQKATVPLALSRFPASSFRLHRSRMPRCFND